MAQARINRLIAHLTPSLYTHGVTHQVCGIPTSSSNGRVDEISSNNLLPRQSSSARELASKYAGRHDRFRFKTVNHVVHFIENIHFTTHACIQCMHEIGMGMLGYGTYM
jgi:hypothetical protein